MKHPSPLIRYGVGACTIAMVVLAVLYVGWEIWDALAGVVM